MKPLMFKALFNQRGFIQRLSQQSQGGGEPPPEFTADVWIAKASDGGSDSNDGLSILTPKLTVNAGITVLAGLGGGKKLAIRRGTYTDILPQSTIPAGSSFANATQLVAYPSDGVGSVILTGGGAGPGHYNANQSYIVWDGFIFDISTNFIIGNGAHHIQLKNFEIKNSADNGILVGSTSPSNQFLSGSIHNCGSNPSGPPHGIYAGSDHNLFEHLDIYSNGTDNPGANEYGIQLHDSSGSTATHDNVIRKCKIHDNLGGGIIVTNGANNQVYDNLVYGNGNSTQGGHGIEMASDGGSSTQVYYNTVYQNGLGSGGGYGIIIQAGAANCDVRNNIEYLNGTGNFINLNGGGTHRANLEGTNPQFVGAPNFHLASGSPARNLGEDLSAIVVDDYDGVSRLTSPFDAGAYQFV